MENKTSDSSLKKKRAFVQLFFVLIIAAGAFIIFKYLINTSPVAKSRKHKADILKVEAVTAETQSVPYLFTAMGTVVASRRVELKPGVQGEIVRTGKNYTTGGFFSAGEIMAVVSPEDYRIALVIAQTEVSKAETALKLEMGNQMVAAKEFQLLGKKVGKSERELMLRKPQLLSAKASLEAAQARVELAKTDFLNTSVKAPFNLVIISKTADLGSRVNQSAPIATITDTDTFLVSFTIPLEKLKWLNNKSGKKIPIRIFSGKGIRNGFITHISSELEKGSNMVVVYGEIRDPLCLQQKNRGKQKLFLGNFVEVEITGSVMHNIVSLDRSLLRNNNTVWVFGENGRLVIRSVKIAASSQDKIFISEGIDSGELIIKSAIDNLKPDMKLSLSHKKEKSRRENVETDL